MLCIPRVVGTISIEPANTLHPDHPVPLAPICDMPGMDTTCEPLQTDLQSLHTGFVDLFIRDLNLNLGHVDFPDDVVEYLVVCLKTGKYPCEQDHIYEIIILSFEIGANHIPSSLEHLYCRP